MTDLVKVRDLFEDHHDQSLWLGYPHLEPEDMPAAHADALDEVGSYVRNTNWLRHVETFEDAVYVEIPGTAWGDYHGSLYTRAAHDYLLDHYRDHLVTRSEHYGAETLYLAVNSEIPEDLADDIRHLLEYGYLDVETWDIEEQIRMADWNGWLGHDIRIALMDSLTGDTHGELPDGMVPDEDELLTMIYDLPEFMDGKFEWEIETATDSYITDQDDLVERLAWNIISEWMTKLPVQEETLDLEGRLSVAELIAELAKVEDQSQPVYLEVGPSNLNAGSVRLFDPEAPEGEDNPLIIAPVETV